MRFLLLGLGFFSLTATFAQTQFSLLSPDQTHISFNNTLRETEKINVLVYQYLYNGGGVGVADINNDQLPDIYFSGNQVPDKLYLNNGDMQFTDISAAAGIDSYSGWHTGVSMADVNGDGYIDLYVCRSGPFNAADRKNLLFINNGNNTFAERAAEYGIDDSSFTTMAAFFDYDRDGDLDLFLLNHAVQQYKGFILSDMRKTRDPFAGNKLLRNDNGHFTDVSEAAGINGSPLTFGLGIGIADIDDDMWPDIFVSNDYQERDFLYHNNGDGTFTEIGTEVFGRICPTLPWVAILPISIMMGTWISSPQTCCPKTTTDRKC
ncbi:MAG: VCBS repeat-containing protein [Chitinophagales bacterium]